MANESKGNNRANAIPRKLAEGAWAYFFGGADLDEGPTKERLRSLLENAWKETEPRTKQKVRKWLSSGEWPSDLALWLCDALIVRLVLACLRERGDTELPVELEPEDQIRRWLAYLVEGDDSLDTRREILGTLMAGGDAKARLIDKIISWQLVVNYAWTTFLEGAGLDEAQTRRALERMVVAVWRGTRPEKREEVQAWLRSGQPPPGLAAWLGDALLALCVRERIVERGDPELPSGPKLDEGINAWLTGRIEGDAERRKELLRTFMTGGAGAERLIDEIIAYLKEVTSMSGEATYYFDRANLPEDFNEAAFKEAVAKALRRLGVDPETDEGRLVMAAVIGMLLLDEHHDPSAPRFGEEAVPACWSEFVGESPIEDPKGAEAIAGYWSNVIEPPNGQCPDWLPEKLGARGYGLDIVRGKSQEELASRYGLEFSSDEWRIITEKVLPHLPPRVPNRLIYAEVRDKLLEVPGNGNSIAYTELALVGRRFTRSGRPVPYYNSRKFGRQAFAGVDQWADPLGGGSDGGSIGGPTGFGTLDLPPLAESEGAGVEIVAENVHAVAMLYAAYQLEQTRLLDVVDRITELFTNGMLPIGYSNLGRKLDRYHWQSEDRLDQAGRFMHYGRVLNAPGVDVSQEVQPNAEYETLWLRFLSSLSAFDRERRIGQIFDTYGGRPMTLTTERIRNAGRALAANASLYGYASTHFAARRINAHVRAALDIVGDKEAQSSFGVNNAWQLVERVASMEFGVAPNIVRHHTMAVAGKAILDLVGRYASVWAGGTGRPLFLENGVSQIGLLLAQQRGLSLGGTIQPDISNEDRDTLLRETEHWLAVNGVRDDQVHENAQPEQIQAAPSLPSLGAARAPSAGGNGAVERIRQMVQAGQMPSQDELMNAFRS